MSTQSNGNTYGIRVNLPENDPMSAPHLLGESWTGERWFNTAAERDRVYSNMMEQPANNRKGDNPSVRLTKVDPD